jgi:hypothetical protein
MWKKSYRGVAVLLLLLLAFSLPAALPSWWPGAKKTAPESPVVVQEQTPLQNDLLTQLEAELTALKQLYTNSQATIVSSNLKTARLETELNALRSLYAVSETSMTVLKGEYDALKAMYDAKVNAPIVTDYESPWGGTVGVGAVYNPSTGKVGAEVSMGVSFRQWTLEVGAGYSPDAWKLELPDFSKMDYRAGLKLSY